MEFRKTPAGERGDPPQPCILCMMSIEDDISHGKFYVLGDLFVHYYCLLFACALEQKGDDNEGVLGFLEDDIKKEAKRGKKLRCVYCLKSSATIGCVISSCRKQFHRPCGVQNGALFQFFGQFKSYCCDHRPVQTFGLNPGPKKGKGKGKVTSQEVAVVLQTDDDPDCPICYESITPQISNDVLWAPCCRKRAWFHRECVQRMALSAGYHFRCPLCNDKKVFKNEMKEFGIYIPDQDASWELVPNPYQELYERYCKCDAEKCQCAKGREYDGRSGKWGIVLCDYCGSRGTHVGCSGLSSIDSNWVCPICVTQAKNDKLEKLPKTPVVRPMPTVREDTDSGDEIDVMPTPQNKLSKVVGSMFRGESSKVVTTKTTARKSTTKNGMHLSPPKVEEKPKTEFGAGPSHSGRRLVKLLSSYKLDVNYLVQSIQQSNLEVPSRTVKKDPQPIEEKKPEPSRQEVKEKVNVLKENGISMEVVGKVKPAPLSVKMKLLEKVVKPDPTPPVNNRPNPSRNVARRGGFRGRGRDSFRAGSRGSSSECSSVSSISPSPPPKSTEEIRVRVGPDGRILNLVFPNSDSSPEKDDVQILRYKPGPKSKKLLQENRKKHLNLNAPPPPAPPKVQEVKLVVDRPCPKSKKLVIAQVVEPSVEPPAKKPRPPSRWDVPPSDYRKEANSGVTTAQKKIETSTGEREKQGKEQSVSERQKQVIKPSSGERIVASSDEPEIIEVADTVSASRLKTMAALRQNSSSRSSQEPSQSSVISVDSFTQFCTLPRSSSGSSSQTATMSTPAGVSMTRLYLSEGPINFKQEDFKERISRSIASLEAQRTSVTPISAKKWGPERKFEVEKPVVNKLWDSFENGHGNLVPSDLKRNSSSDGSSKSIVFSSRKAIKRK